MKSTFFAVVVSSVVLLSAGAAGAAWAKEPGKRAAEAFNEAHDKFQQGDLGGYAEKMSDVHDALGDIMGGGSGGNDAGSGGAEGNGDSGQDGND